VPAAQAAARPKADTPQLAAIDVARGKLVVVIDNDPRVLEGMSGLLRDWGCRVVTGFVDGRNVAIEYRWAEGDVERLPALASELVRHGGGMAPALAAKAATQSIPIVYYSGGDPVRTGLAASINRPGGNVTGISNFSEILEAKRLDLLHRLVPKARPRNHCDVGKAGFEALLCRQVIDRVEGCCCQFFMSTRPEHHARQVMLTPPYVLEPAPDSEIAAAARTALHAILGLGRRT
jgi:ABC transporter substrate binding protein